MELKMNRFEYKLIPKRFRCFRCAEEHKGAYLDDKLYTKQTPKRTVLETSDKRIILEEEGKQYEFRHVCVNVITECEVCGKENEYPMGYWFVRKQEEVKI